MKNLKRMTVALLALLPLATGAAFADSGQGYSRMFVFGASFLDPGNHFAVTGETAHPPFDPMSHASYGIGGHHYSNGRTWVEVLAQKLDLTDWAKPAYRDPAFGNYAFGYAFARDVDFPAGPGLGDQVQDWIGNGYCTYAAMDDTLFVLDTAYFDLFDILQGADPDDVIPAMLNSIATNIYILNQCGARNLLVANIAPIGLSPMIPDDGSKAFVNLLSMGYNEAVQIVLAGYAGEPFNMNISTFDLFHSFADMAANREAYGLTNVDETCVTFGVRKNAFCKDRDSYLFWDPLHPTKVAHAVMGEAALGQLPVPD
jgi:phospholipase/lecithinase/hemolysin